MAPSTPVSGAAGSTSTTSPLVPVILCGGTGTRLWPLSRATYPKQYWPLAGEGEETLLQQTQLRLAGLAGLAPPLLICNEDHRFIVAEQMRQIGVEPAAILLEPIGRNTAPAVAVAALQATAQGEDPLLLVLAADHVIRDAERFREAVSAGLEAAAAGRLVTFGIVPTAPETGYGYIEAAESLASETGVPPRPVPIARFVEKPDRATAEAFLATGRFTWNSGMFLFRASAILAELERLAPEVVSACRSALEHDAADLDFLRLEREAFAGCPSVALDVAVMEKTELGSVLPLQAGWSDVGSWSALWQTADQDAAGNVLRGRVISEASRNCYLRSEHRRVVGLGGRFGRGRWGSAEGEVTPAAEKCNGTDTHVPVQGPDIRSRRNLACYVSSGTGINACPRGSLSLYASGEAARGA
jgi:mannose-1-phosphate guanylyltransferase